MHIGSNIDATCILLGMIQEREDKVASYSSLLTGNSYMPIKLIVSATQNYAECMCSLL